MVGKWAALHWTYQRSEKIHWWKLLLSTQGEVNIAVHTSPSPHTLLHNVHLQYDTGTMQGVGLGVGGAGGGWAGGLAPHYWELLSP